MNNLGLVIAGALAEVSDLLLFKKTNMLCRV